MQSTQPLPVVLPSPIAKRPHLPNKGWHVPRLLLQVKDVCHPGAVKYFSTTNTETLLRDAVIGVLEKLYTHETAPTRYVPLLTSIHQSSRLLTRAPQLANAR